MIKDVKKGNIVFNKRSNSIRNNFCGKSIVRKLFPYGKTKNVFNKK